MINLTRGDAVVGCVARLFVLRGVDVAGWYGWMKRGEVASSAFLGLLFSLCLTALGSKTASISPVWCCTLVTEVDRLLSLFFR